MNNQHPATLSHISITIWCEPLKIENSNAHNSWTDRPIFKKFSFFVSPRGDVPKFIANAKFLWVRSQGRAWGAIVARTGISGLPVALGSLFEGGAFMLCSWATGNSGGESSAPGTSHHGLPGGVPRAFPWFIGIDTRSPQFKWDYLPVHQPCSSPSLGFLLPLKAATTVGPKSLVSSTVSRRFPRGLGQFDRPLLNFTESTGTQQAVTLRGWFRHAQIKQVRSRGLGGR